MKCHEVTERFPDYLAGRLDETEQAAMQTHFAFCSSCREEAENLSAFWQRLEALPEEQPSEALRARFYAALAAYQQQLHAVARPRLSEIFDGWLARWWPRQPAFQFARAMLFLCAGWFFGQRWDADENRLSEMSQLRDEVSSMRQLVVLSLLQQQSPSERLRGVSWSYQAELPDTEVLSALLETLNHDPNVNVRLAAVDALSRFGEQPMVRRGLVASLAKQNSPLIQVALIDLLIERGERQAVSTFKQLQANEMVDKAVRQRIEFGIQQLQQD